MQLADAIEAVVDHESGLREWPIRPGSLAMTSGSGLAIGDAVLDLEGDGIKRLCEQLSAPANYLAKLDDDLRQLVLQRHLDQGDGLRNCSTILSRDNRLLGFGRADLCRIQGAEVLEAVRQGTQRELTAHDLQLSDDSLQLDLLVSDQAQEVASGDVLSAGLRVTHTFSGRHATWIECFVLRLVCTNGLIHRECQGRQASRTRRLPANRENSRRMQVDQVRRLSSELIATLDRKLTAIAKLRQSEVEVDALFTRWLNRARLSPRLWLPTLQEAWRTEGSEETAYGVMNAFTRVATHDRDLSPRQRRILSGLAGILAFEDLHYCQHCFSFLGATSPQDQHEPEPIRDFGALAS